MQVKQWCPKTMHFFFLFLALWGTFSTALPHGCIDRSLEMKQRVRGTRLLHTESSWILTTYIPSPFRCAGQPITATFTLETRLPSEVNVFLRSSINTLIDWYYDPDANAFEVQLDRGLTENECGNRAFSTLNLILVCPDCVSVTSNVEYTVGYALNTISATPLTVHPNIAGYQTLRFSTEVHKDVLARGGGTEFTAMLLFEVEEGIRIDRFIARPRSLLTENQAWVTESHGASYHRFLYAALQLPLEWDENHLPQLIVDVNCVGCSNVVKVAYKLKRPEWNTVYSQAVFKNFNLQKGNRVFMNMRNATTTERGKTSMRTWLFQTSAINLCRSTFNGWVHVVTGLPFTPASFYWYSGNMRYEAKAFQKFHRHLVRWIPSNDAEPCTNLDEPVSLFMTCFECDDVYYAEAYVPLKPDAPPDAFIYDGTRLAGHWEKTDVCYVYITTKKTDLRKIYTETIQLWQSSDRTICDFSDANKSKEMRNVLRHWEQELNTNYGSFPRVLSGGWKELCENLEGRLYSMIDAEPAELVLYDGSVRDGASLNTVDDSKNFVVTSVPSLYTDYGVVKWSVTTVVAASVVGSFCSQDTELHYTITRLPEVPVDKRRILVSNQWKIEIKENQDDLVVMALRPVSCQMAVNVVQFDIDCGQPCEKPALSVAVRKMESVGHIA